MYVYLSKYSLQKKTVKPLYSDKLFTKQNGTLGDLYTLNIIIIKSKEFYFFIKPIKNLYKLNFTLKKGEYSKI